MGSGEPHVHWAASLLLENRVGVEPTTLGLRGPCSTIELPVQFFTLAGPAGLEPGFSGLKVHCANPCTTIPKLAAR